MNFIPKRRKRSPMGLRESSVIKCPGHLKWVRGHECCVAGKRLTAPLGSVFTHQCEGRMEAHHSTTRGAGGGDETAVPLCSLAHKNVHDGCGFDVNFDSIAALLWKASPHRVKWERDNE